MDTATDLNDRLSAAGVMLREAWYYALASNQLQRGQTVHRTILGEPILIGRDSSGAVFALCDTCPHRGTLLSRGAFNTREVQLGIRVRF